MHTVQKWKSYHCTPRQGKQKCAALKKYLNSYLARSLDFSIACVLSCCLRLCNAIPWAASAATTVRSGSFRRETGNGVTCILLAAERDLTLFFFSFFLCVALPMVNDGACRAASEVSVSAVAAFHRLVVVVDVAFACFCLPGRVPAPPCKGEAWGCTTRERVSSKMLRLKTEKKTKHSLSVHVTRVQGGGKDVVSPSISVFHHRPSSPSLSTFIPITPLLF